MYTQWHGHCRCSTSSQHITATHRHTHTHSDIYTDWQADKQTDRCTDQQLGLLTLCSRLTDRHSMPHVQHLTLCTHTHTFNGPFSGLPGWAGTRKAKPIWILLKQETVSGSGISWAICKSAPRSRQITMPVPHHSSFYRPDALPAAQPTASKHWRNILCYARPNNTHVGRCKLSLILTLTPTLIRHPH